MASSSCSSNTSWTPQQNKLFEQALAEFDKDTQDRWQKIGKKVGKSAADVKRHYDILVKDVERIENGQVPYPYRATGRNG